MATPLFNARGRDALVQAALDGVPQCFGTLHHAAGIAEGKPVLHSCAIGVFHLVLHEGDTEAAYRCFASTPLSKEKVHTGLAILTIFGVKQNYGEPCTICGLPDAHRPAHYNDFHQMDFLTLARKFGPPED